MTNEETMMVLIPNGVTFTGLDDSPYLKLPVVGVGSVGGGRKKVSRKISKKKKSCKKGVNKKDKSRKSKKNNKKSRKYGKKTGKKHVKSKKVTRT